MPLWPTVNQKLELLVYSTDIDYDYRGIYSSLDTAVLVILANVNAR